MSDEACSLAEKECKPCQGGVPPLAGEELQSLHDELGNDWQVIDCHHLEKEYSFKNFAEALEFTRASRGPVVSRLRPKPSVCWRWPPEWLRGLGLVWRSRGL